MALIPLSATRGDPRAYALVDDEDVERLSVRAWQLASHGYAIGATSRTVGRRLLMLHREVLGLPPGREPEVDHINGDKLDCRKANLRTATHALNMQNKRSYGGAHSRYRGVSFDGRSSARTAPWRAEVQIGGVRRTARFWTETEAAAAASEWRALLMPFTNEERV